MICLIRSELKKVWGRKSFPGLMALLKTEIILNRRPPPLEIRGGGPLCSGPE